MCSGPTCSADAMTWTWTVEHEEDGATVTDYSASGRGVDSVEVVLERAAQVYTVRATAVGAGGERTLSLEEPVMCKYVRREVRKLTTTDRERYLAAAALFHTLDADAGRRKYGAKFTNYKESVAKHLARMTLDGCTPYHGYDTFLTAHESFVLEFEQALQAVDPAISAPYWDYTIDTVKYGHVGRVAAESDIFKDDWFGPLDNSKHGDVLTSKHFSHLPVALDRDLPEHNGFGYVTDSVNQNDSPYVTRVSSICGLPTKATLAGCTELKSIFNAGSLSQLRSQIETVYHATLHMSLGGVSDCAFSLKDAVADESMGGPDRPALFEAIGQMANTLWRSMELGKIMRCDSDCSTETDSFATCQCSCPSVDAWSDDEKYELAYAQLEHMGMTNMLLSESGTANYFETSKAGMVQLKDATSDENKAFWKWFVDFSCHPGKMAPYATPLAANNDPIFWVSHAAWGRYWHFVRLAPSFATDFHNDWMDPTTKNFLDHWQNVSNCENMLTLDDVLPFKGFTRDDAKGEAKPYSNRELLDLFSPNNPDLPYMYSDFDWSHCGDSL